MGKVLSPEQIADNFIVDTDNGVLGWKPKPNGMKGRPRVTGSAGSLNAGGYLVVRVTMDSKARTFLVHRIIWAAANANWPHGLDHINGDKTDNRITNLRPATEKENARNRKLYRTNRSGYKGVFWKPDHKKWQAYIRDGKKLIHLGYYDDPAIAHSAYRSAGEKLFGGFFRAQ